MCVIRCAEIRSVFIDSVTKSLYFAVRMYLHMLCITLGLSLNYPLQATVNVNYQPEL